MARSNRAVARRLRPPDPRGNPLNGTCAITAATSVMASLDAMQAIDGMASATWQNRVAPGVLFDMMRYRPTEAAAKLLVPLLVCIAADDREAPADLIDELVAAARHGRSIRYPVSHFDVYRPDIRAQLIEDQITFLREVL